MSRHAPLLALFAVATTALACMCGGGKEEVLQPAVVEEVVPEQEPLPEEPPAPASRLGPRKQAALAAALGDLRIYPGERIGTITQTATHDSLVAKLGEAAVERTEVNLGEGYVEQGTRVGANTPYAVDILWADGVGAGVKELRQLGVAWRTQDDIGVGTPLTRLQGILGPFNLRGFGWDGGGTIDLEGTSLARYSGLLILRLGRGEDGDPGQERYVSGDKPFPSTDPHVRALRLEVSEVIVRMPE